MPPSANDIIVRVIPDVQASGGALSSQFKKVAAPIQKVVGDALSNALDTSFSPRELNKIQKRMANMQVEAVKAREVADIKVRAIEKRLRKKNLDDDQRDKLRNVKNLANLEAKNLEDRVKKEADHVTAQAARSKKALEALGRDVTHLSSESAEKFGESLTNAFSDLKSGDLGNMVGLLKRMGTGVKEKGLETEAKAGTGASGKMMGKIGQFMGKIGPALVGIAALAGAVAAIVKIIVDADTVAKEFNKTILEGGTATLDVANDVWELTDRLRTMQAAYTDFDVNTKWGMVAKDHADIINAYSAAGLTPKEIVTGVNDEVKALQNATTAAVKYSKLLGMTASEVATSFAENMETFGMSLTGIQHAFDAVAISAQESGFGTKRFVGMVLQATSGMSMYNVRLNETAALLSELTKILGAGGEDLLKDLLSGFRGEGTKDRITRTKKMGAGYAKKEIYVPEANRSVEELLSKIGALDKPGQKEKANAALLTALQRFGVGDLEQLEELKKQPEKMAKMFSKLSIDERSMLAAQIGSQLGASVEDAVQASMAHRRGAGGVSAAMQVGSASATFLSKLFQGRKALGGKGLHEVDEGKVRQMIAAEEMGQAQGEEMLRLSRSGRHFKGIDETLKGFQDRIRDTEDLEEKKKIAQEYNVTHAKDFGVALGEMGGRFAGTAEQMKQMIADLKDTEGLAVLEDGFNNLVRGFEDKLRGQELDATRDKGMELAEETASATTGMLQFLEVGIETALMKIHGVVKDILAAMPWADTPLEGAALQAQAGAMKQIKAEGEAKQKEMDEARKEYLKLKDAAKKEEDPEKKEMLKGQVEEAEAKAFKLKAEREGLRKEERLVRGFRTEEQVETWGAATRPDSFRGAGASTRVLHTDRMLREFLEEKLPGLAEALSGAHKKGAAEVELPSGPMGVGVKESLKLQEAQLEQSFSASDKEEALWQDLLAAGSMSERKKIIAAELAAEKTTWIPQAKIVAEAMVAEQKKAQLQELLGEAGMDKSLAPLFATGSVGGLGSLTQEQKDILLSRKGLLTPGTIKSLGGKTDDMVLQIGAGGVKFAQRVDPNDVGVFSKPGGALSKMGGGGGGVNVFHMYNDGPGALQTIIKAQKAGVLD